MKWALQQLKWPQTQTLNQSVLVKGSAISTMSIQKINHSQPTRIILRCLASLSATWGRYYLQEWKRTGAFLGTFLLSIQMLDYAHHMRQGTSRRTWSQLVPMNARLSETMCFKKFYNWYVSAFCTFLQDCLPNCEETRYTATVSASPFRRCDFRTLGINPLCDLAMEKGTGTSFATLYPQMWGQSAIEQYR